MSADELFEAGRKIGAEAFAAGRTATPALDPAVILYIRENLKGAPVGTAIPLLDGWHRGWAEANVAAPVGMIV